MPRAWGRGKVNVMRVLALMATCGVIMSTALAADTPPAPPKSGDPLGTVFNDRDLTEHLIGEAEALMEAGRTPKLSELRRQLTRKHCQVRLAPAREGWLRPSDLVAAETDGVLVLGSLYKCTQCNRWHFNAAGGYVISETGVAVTCYHVVQASNGVALVAMTRQGKVYPVREVLAASAANDLAVVQLDGSGFRPVPLGGTAPVGATVYVISHPDQQYYTLTGGLVSRYVKVRKRGGLEATLMSITAEFARGSSGCPVFDRRGAVVGTVVSTHSIYYETDRDQHDNLQMVLKQCAPSGALLELIQP